MPGANNDRWAADPQIDSDEEVDVDVSGEEEENADDPENHPQTIYLDEGPNQFAQIEKLLDCLDNMESQPNFVPPPMFYTIKGHFKSGGSVGQLLPKLIELHPIEMGLEQIVDNYEFYEAEDNAVEFEDYNI